MSRHVPVSSVGPTRAVFPVVLVVATISLSLLPTPGTLALGSFPVRNLERTLGLRIASPEASIRVSGSWLVFAVDERDQDPSTDLNGDGDTADDVVHAYNLGSRTKTKLEIASYGRLVVSGVWVVFAVPESQQSAQDLNGDRDARDHVRHVFDHETGPAANLGLAVAFNEFPLAPEFHGFGDWVLVADDGTQALHIHSLESGNKINTELVVTTEDPLPVLEDDGLLFFVFEPGPRSTKSLPYLTPLSALDDLRVFLRGDCNVDGDVDLSDAVCILSWLFLGQAGPGCLSAANVDSVGAVDITNAIYLLMHLSCGGPPPLQPFPACGNVTSQEEKVLRFEVPQQNCEGAR